ncbi:FAD dependent oxidoreductase [Mycena belliarum]|uniref:FAD dependent oxidoreductase n=1 Tax=Mycena belliarum TaxID=1033014 RepID=A0AAD6XRJ6_9AGAR|nr:FAD dependent oxidoreductase [Mycena belliae]
MHLSSLRLFPVIALASSAFALDVCAQIQQSVSSATDVYYPVDLLGRYAADLAHWASSSSQPAACTVEPGTVADVSEILKLIGASNTSFAVKGGGHTANPGFSSTPGVLIAMSRLSEVTYDAASQSVDIGPGLVWDDVYTVLAPHNVNVVGGRVTGVGVAGFTLGGGYSWKTNQFGLTVDTVVGYELVAPNGTVVAVTGASDPDLFFALKGGMNNFGIVTKFTLQTFPQGQVWGGLITYTVAHLPAVAAAVAKFASTVEDPKAGLLPTWNFLLGQPGVSNLLFYDGSTPPEGLFDDFLAIPHLTMDVSTRDFLSLVKSAPSNATSGSRGAFHTVPLLSFSSTMLAAIHNETTFWGDKLALAGAAFISYDVEPFLPTLYSHNTNATAFPPTRDAGYLPLNLYFAWGPATSDEIFHAALRRSAAHLTQVALAEGQAIADAPLYPNYALFDTPLERMYGANVERLRAIKGRVDPKNVMGLAGGFKF